MKFMRKFLGRAILASAVILAGFGDPQAQTGASPSIIFLETDQALPDGLWRTNLNGDVFTISKNTAAANNFTTGITALSIDSSGNLTFSQLVTVGTGKTGTYDAITIDQIDRTTDGSDDSGAIILTGVGFESATPHDADWKIFVDVTANTGVSTWTLQERIDAGGFVTAFTVDGTGNGVLENSLSVSSTFAASSGALRIANDAALNWRNAANDGDIGISIDDSDVFQLGVGVSLFSVQSAQVIDVTGTEAFLVRQNADAGDIFFVDTTNDEVEIPTGALILGLGNAAVQDSLIIDGTDLAGDGTQDSGAIILTGLGFESATPHDADWKAFVDVTSNAGASTWTLQSRIDAASFADFLTITSAGRMTFGNTSFQSRIDTVGTSGQVAYMESSGFNANFAAQGGTTLNLQTNGNTRLTVNPTGLVSTLYDFAVHGDPTPFIGAKIEIKAATAILAMTSGSSVTATSLIPAGSFVVGIVTRVNDLVTGPAGYDVGDGVDVDRWGNSIAVADTTTSDVTDFTSAALTLFPAANDVVITSDGVDFTAGNIRVIVYYMTLTAPTSD